MKKTILALLTLASLTGCGTIVSGNATNSSASTDDVWYAKTSYILIFVTSSDVYYCPPAQAAGQKTCKKAVMHDE